MFTRLNTILLTEERSQDSVLKITGDIFKDRGVQFRIDNKIYFAHVTLYSPEYPSHNVSKVKEEVEKISRTVKPITLEFNDFYTGWGYFGLDFVKDEAIDALHRQVLETLNPLREGRIREKYTEEIKGDKYPPEQVEYISQYGYHNILNNFHPHLTLGRFSSEEVALEVKRKLDKSVIPTPITFPYLAVSEMGPHGTCTKILARYKLLALAPE